MLNSHVAALASHPLMGVIREYQIMKFGYLLLQNRMEERFKAERKIENGGGGDSKTTVRGHGGVLFNIVAQ